MAAKRKAATLKVTWPHLMSASVFSRLRGIRRLAQRGVKWDEPEMMAAIVGFSIRMHQLEVAIYGENGLLTVGENSMGSPGDE
jgi:hypothetical protein